MFWGLGTSTYRQEAYLRETLKLVMISIEILVPMKLEHSMTKREEYSHLIVKGSTWCCAKRERMASE